MGFATYGLTPENVARFAALPEEVEDRCSGAVMQRARGIVRDAEEKFLDLYVERDAGNDLMTVHGTVRGTTAPSRRYTPWFEVDRRTEEMGDCGCSCPAYFESYSCCKHIAALALLLADHPGRFHGFRAPPAGAAGDDDIMEYMERLDDLASRHRLARLRRLQEGNGGGTATFGATSQAARRAGRQEDAAVPDPGQVRLDPTLRYDDGLWHLQFRIVNAANGGSYVVRSLDSFLQAMRAGLHVRYGVKLEFDHTPDMLDERSLRLLRFLDQASEIRDAMRADSWGTSLYHRYGGYGGYGGGGSDREMRLSEAEAARLLQLCEGGRIGLVKGDQASAPSTPVAVSGEEWDAHLTVSEATSRGRHGCRVAGDRRIELVVSGDGIEYVLTSERDALPDARHGVRRFLRLPRRYGPLIPVLPALCAPEGRFIADDDLPLFARTLLPQLEDAGLEGTVPARVRRMKPVPCTVGFYLDRDERGITCGLEARYDDVKVGLLPPAPATVHGARDYDMERAAERLVRRYFTVPPAGRRDAGAVLDDGDASSVARLFDEALPAFRSVGDVFTTPAFDRLMAPRPPRLHVSLAMHGGLVEVMPLADEVPPDEVAALIASYRRRQRFHRLKDGTLVPLDGMDVSGLEDLAADLGLAEEALDGGTVDVPAFQAFLLDSEVGERDKDASFRSFVDDVRVIDPSRYEVPPSLRKVLRPYQVEGYRWLQTLCDKGFGGILADEMGLGKSVQLIAMLLARRDEARRVGPSLIVCPASLVYNWAAEFARFAPELEVRAVAGTRAQRRALLDALPETPPDGAGKTSGDASDVPDVPDVLVTSYDLLRLDAESYRGHRLFVCALDEAQAIKNHTTKAAKAVKSLDAMHRFALTGTPIENRLSELWSVFDFLMPGLLGTFRSFHERYELPISAARNDPTGEERARRLQALVGTFILRRLKSQVLDDLPDKLETTVTVRLEGEQRRLYAAHERRLRMTLDREDARDFDADRIRILAELTKLRQLCCDPRLLYVDAKDRSAKLAAIEELIEAAIGDGKKTLVFSQFTSFLDLIAARLDSRRIRHYAITGATPKRRRIDLVDAFNAGPAPGTSGGHDEASVPVFLISLKAGNTGLNLVGASVVIHADPWWNAAAEDQATDRAHRIGQTRDVNVYRIVAGDTIEERILRLQETKSELARRFVDQTSGDGRDDGQGTAASVGGAAAGIGRLTRDELLALLS